MPKKILKVTFVLVLLSLLLSRLPAKADSQKPEGRELSCQMYFDDRLGLVRMYDLYKTTSQGWQKLGTPTVWTTFDVLPDGIVYLWHSLVHQIYQSANGGENWTLIGVFPDGEGQLYRFFPSPLSSAFFVAGTQGIYRSIDGGTTWEHVFSRDMGSSGEIAFSPNFAQDGIAFASASGYHTAEGIWKTTDWGATWRLVLDGTPALAGYFIAVSPQFSQDRTVFAAANGTVKSVDGGESWSWLDQAPGGWPYVPILSPQYAEDQTLLQWSYEMGLYLSQDGGQTWRIIYKSDEQNLTNVCGAGLRRSGPFGAWPTIPLPGPYKTYLPLVNGYTEPLPLEFWVMTQRSFTGDQNLYRSRDYGSTWEEVPVFEASHWLYLPLVSRGTAGN